ncbi:hypothetical protein RchiOBHm_Chr1g0334211 [Rosa chinensis]|uniref:Uncharacterized protein n=1 Tax=Rosa chinensis TaxID=74649 RepID=A0A2P6SCB3_ROSCH|nr:hypothetical protein RchiOBHm_Chr1g0334211 [Rosa chinensis]
MVQNMRHQYLGVKQKIRVSKDEFNWKDGENHWENFLKYKEVFGDVELDGKGKRLKKKMKKKKNIWKKKKKKMVLVVMTIIVARNWVKLKLEWRERMVGLQIQHEKQMMQMHAEACQNQLQILGVMARFVCQFFGSMSDGLGGGLGTLPPQILQNLQHPGGLGDKWEAGFQFAF